MKKTILFVLLPLVLAGCSSGPAEQVSSLKPTDSASLPAISVELSPVDLQPLYQVTWNGAIDGKPVADPVEVILWGGPNAQTDQFAPQAMLLMGLPAFGASIQNYRLAIESYGCFPDYSQPGNRQFYFTDSRVMLPRQGRSAPQQIPVAVQTRLLNASEQQAILAGAKQPVAEPQIVLPVGSCEVVRRAVTP